MGKKRDALVHFPNTVRSVLERTSELNPRKVIVVVEDENGDWHTGWSNQLHSELLLGIKFLEQALDDAMRGNLE